MNLNLLGVMARAAEIAKRALQNYTHLIRVCD